MQESDLPGLTATRAVGRLRAGRGLRRHRAAHALLHHGRGGRHRQHRRLDAHAHVGAGHRRGHDRLQRHGGGGLGRGRRTASTPGPRLLWLSNLVGGLLFGFGMVLASGCGSKTLVRVGGGNLKSLVVLCVLAVAAYATMRGVAGGGARGHAGCRGRRRCRPGRTCRRCWPMPPAHRARRWRCWLGGGLGLALVAWVLSRPEGRGADVLLAGLGIGAVIVGVWWVSGRLGFVRRAPDDAGSRASWPPTRGAWSR